MSTRGKGKKPFVLDRGMEADDPFAFSMDEKTDAGVVAGGEAADADDPFGGFDAGESDLEIEESPLSRVPVTGNNEVDLAAQLNAFQLAAKEALRNEIKSKDDMFDSEFWIAVCFQSREQKEAFLRALNLLDHGDKYLDGYVVAEKLGVELPGSGKVQFSNKINSKWLEFVDDTLR